MNYGGKKFILGQQKNPDSETVVLGLGSVNLEKCFGVFAFFERTSCAACSAVGWFSVLLIATLCDWLIQNLLRVFVFFGISKGFFYLLANFFSFWPLFL